MPMSEAQLITRVKDNKQNASNTNFNLIPQNLNTTFQGKPLKILLPLIQYSEVPTLSTMTSLT